MLAGTEPRGLPGTSIDTVHFQRAAAGRPLDDVIVHAHDESDHNAVLEIQVKRSITFSPSDAVFRFDAGTVEFSSASRNLISLRGKPLSLASPSGQLRPAGSAPYRLGDTP